MLAYNNVKKVESRDLIVETIKRELPGQKIRMVELLGAGVGIKHYNRNLDLFDVALIEKDKKSFDSFNILDLVDEKKEVFGEDHPISVSKHNCDIYKYFDKQMKTARNQFSFNVINLDFCSWFYDNNQKNCTAQIICKMFASGALEDGGLLFLTFQVKGWNLDRNKAGHKRRHGEDIPLTLGEIGSAVWKCALKHGYRLGVKPIMDNVYTAKKPGVQGRGNEMVNIAFKVTKTG